MLIPFEETLVKVSDIYKCVTRQVFVRLFQKSFDELILDMLSLTLCRWIYCRCVSSLLLGGNSLTSVAKPLELVEVVEQDFLDHLLDRRFCLVVKQLHVFLFEYDCSLVCLYSETLTSNKHSTTNAKIIPASSEFLLLWVCVTNLINLLSALFLAAEHLHDGWNIVRTVPSKLVYASIYSDLVLVTLFSLDFLLLVSTISQSRADHIKVLRWWTQILFLA